MAKKGMKRPGYTGPEAQNQNPTANPQNSTGKGRQEQVQPQSDLLIPEAAPRRLPT